MSPFIDKNGREIEIEADEYGAKAYHGGRRIGSIETTGPIECDPRTTPEPPRITGWDVEPEFRRAGICGEMLRRVVEECEGPLQPAEVYMGVKNENALTEDGMAMTRWGQRQGLIFRFPHEQPED